MKKVLAAKLAIVTMLTMFLCSAPVMAAQQAVVEETKSGPSALSVITIICLIIAVVLGIVGAKEYKKKTGEDFFTWSSRKR